MTQKDYEKGREDGRAGKPPEPWAPLDKQAGWKKGNEEFKQLYGGGFKFEKLARPLVLWEKVAVLAGFWSLFAATFFAMYFKNSVGLLWSIVAAFLGGLIGAGLTVFAARYYWVILVVALILYLIFKR